MGLELAYQGTDHQCELIVGANGFRLPFEAKWEFAAKGGQRYESAGSDNIDEVAWYDENYGVKTHPVAQKNPNGYGLYGMMGNVWEWFADAYDNCGQHRPAVSRRTVRGGCWLDGTGYCPVLHRNWHSPVGSYCGIGLHLFRSIG